MTILAIRRDARARRVEPPPLDYLAELGAGDGLVECEWCGRLVDDLDRHLSPMYHVPRCPLVNYAMRAEHHGSTPTKDEGDGHSD